MRPQIEISKACRRFIAAMLLVACVVSASHAEAEEAEEAEAPGPRELVVALDQAQPVVFHRRLRALSRGFASTEPGERLQIRMTVPRDGQRRAIATRRLAVAAGWITFMADDEMLALDASGEHRRVGADGVVKPFGFRAEWHITLTVSASVQDGEQQPSIATLSPNAVKGLGDEADGPTWQALELPLRVEVADDHDVIVLMVETSDDFEGTIDWHMPAYK